MTATVRGTPSLTVAATQNTAPVFEFRCLYTHDVRKKKKIWHDGSLRFHTFNRRVIVYDDSKNYIGDAHWRETGNLNEGEELKLDKGVMVEIGEKIGQTETDLAPVILNKRRAEATSSPPRVPPPSNTYSSWPRLASTIAKDRPMSLAAVLGASQGPIGRARLPGRSPFEQREDNIRRQPETLEGRPTKRPRIAINPAEKEDVRDGSNPVTQAQRPTPQASRAALAKTIHPASPWTQTALARSNPLESSERLLTQPPSPSLSARKKKGKSQHGLTLLGESGQPPSPPALSSTVRSAQDAPQNRTSSVTASKQKSKKKVYVDGQTVQPRKTKDTRAVTNKPSASTHAYKSSVANKLRLAVEKPRRKLMYRDLLPQIRQEKRQRQTDNGKDRRRQDDKIERRASEVSRIAEENSSRGSHITDLVSEDEDGEELPRAVKTPFLTNMDRMDQEISSPSPRPFPSPSPLFVNQSPHSTDLIASQQSFGEDFEPPLHSKSPDREITHNESTDVLQNSEEDPLEDVTGLAEDSVATEAGAVNVVPQSPSNLAFLDRQLLQNSGAIEFLPEGSLLPSKQRPFRRILSEGDAHNHHRSEKGATEIPYDTSGGTTACVGPASKQLQKPFRSPTKVQRSISDVTHLAQRKEMPGRDDPATAAVKAAFDPWSELEAYLLFDWWPVGRRKPSFAVV